MTLYPILALAFGSEAFFPVALTSVLGGAIRLLGRSMSTHMVVGQLTAELVQDLVSADKDRRDLVLAELNEPEGNWFLAELPRAEAELRRRQGRNHAAWCITAVGRGGSLLSVPAGYIHPASTMHSEISTRIVTFGLKAKSHPRRWSG